MLRGRPSSWKALLVSGWHQCETEYFNDWASHGLLFLILWSRKNNVLLSIESSWGKKEVSKEVTVGQEGLGRSFPRERTISHVSSRQLRVAREHRTSGIRPLLHPYHLCWVTDLIEVSFPPLLPCAWMVSMKWDHHIKHWVRCLAHSGHLLMVGNFNDFISMFNKLSSEQQRVGIFRVSGWYTNDTLNWSRPEPASDYHQHQKFLTDRGHLSSEASSLPLPPAPWCTQPIQAEPARATVALALKDLGPRDRSDLSLIKFIVIQGTLSRKWPLFHFGRWCRNGYYDVFSKRLREVLVCLQSQEEGGRKPCAPVVHSPFHLPEGDRSGEMVAVYSFQMIVRTEEEIEYASSVQELYSVVYKHALPVESPRWDPESILEPISLGYVSSWIHWSMKIKRLFKTCYKSGSGNLHTKQFPSGRA